MSPYFSIIIPVYNRQREIKRAVISCLSQAFGDFEIIIVDDASTDQTPSVIQALRQLDPRVHIIKNRRNLGVCPTRNCGIKAASGMWCVMLDSDMSLIEGALQNLRDQSIKLDAAIGNLITRLQVDFKNKYTPDHTETHLGLAYDAYLRWMESVGNPEYFNCIRRSVFSSGVTYPDSRAYEGGFHLNLARQFRVTYLPIVSAIYHTDAENRLCAPRTLGAAHRRLKLNATDHLIDGLTILKQHGRAMKENAPNRYKITLRGALQNALISGHRLAAWKLLKEMREIKDLKAAYLLLTCIGLFSKSGATYILARYQVRKNNSEFK